MNYFNDKFCIYVKNRCDFDIFWPKFFLKKWFLWKINYFLIFENAIKNKLNNIF